MAEGLTRSEALSLLKKHGCPPDVIRHCLAVSDYAVSLAERIRANGHPVDVSFVESSALLHDIGRCNTHGIGHGIVGSEILRDHPRYARVCERHIGAGLTSGEAEELGLPVGDYVPETLEEKIVAHADNLMDGDRVVSLKEALQSLKERLGADHPQVARVAELGEYIRSLL